MDNYKYVNNAVTTGSKFDVVVIGGGTAGSTAAIASAMSGANTLLIERNTFLGGTCTGGQVTPMMSNRTEGAIDTSSVNMLLKKQLYTDSYSAHDGYGNDGWFNPEMMKFALEQVYVENGGKLLYDTEFIDSVVENDMVTGVVVHNRSGLQLIEGKVFVDCTGDAELSYVSGVPCDIGNAATHSNQSVSLRFMVSNVDIERLHEFLKRLGENCILKLPLLEIASEWYWKTPLSDIFRKAVADGALAYEDTVYFQGFSVPGMPGTISFNCPEIPDLHNALSAQEMTAALIKGREMIPRLFRFLKTYLEGFENSFIMSVSDMVGVRESRRIQGEYVLNENDFQCRSKFSDGISKTSYSIDIHGEMDEKTFNLEPMKAGEYTEIPFRCLVPKKISNLLVAGRCISSSFIAQSAVRIQPTCRETGEAAGIAAAYCAMNGIAVRNLEIRIVQQAMHDRLFHSQI